MFSIEFSEQLIFHHRFYFLTNIQWDFLLHGEQIKSSNNIIYKFYRLHAKGNAMFRVTNNKA